MAEMELEQSLLIQKITAGLSAGPFVAPVEGQSLWDDADERGCDGEGRKGTQETMGKRTSGRRSSCQNHE